MSKKIAPSPFSLKNPKTIANVCCRLPQSIYLSRIIVPVLKTLICMQKMKQCIAKIIGAALCCAPWTVYAQTADNPQQPHELYQQGKNLFQQKAYSALISPLQSYLRLTDEEGKPLPAIGNRQEAAYMLACADYELKHPQRIEKLRAFLDLYPDTPHAHRIHALIASAYFFDGDYRSALDEFELGELYNLETAEQWEMTYRMALCQLQTGQLGEAAAWMEAVKAESDEHDADCTYYLSYIQYTQNKTNEALQGFLSLRNEPKYERLVPYYIAEIYLLQQNNEQALAIAQKYLEAYPGEAHAAQMHRIAGTVQYRAGRYHEAMKAFDTYLAANDADETAEKRRDALYMAGLSRYRCGVFSTVAQALLPVTTVDDALTQNAYLHTGLAYLQTGEKNKARMAFEQAANSNADRAIKEQAAYNHALCIHETSFSAFGESVNVFEKFLNEFPQSRYADRVSNYLVEVYMNTRSYEAALQSINRIGRPTAAILEAKQKILFQLGTQAFANARFDQALEYLKPSIALGRYNAQTLAEAYYWMGESDYRLNQLDASAAAFHQYIAKTPNRSGETFALAHYNLGYIAFHQKNYPLAQSHFTTYTQLEKGNNRNAQADAYNRLGDCALHNRHFAQATTYYTQAENLRTPAGDYSCYQLALVAGLQKDYNRKVALLNRLQQVYPSSPYIVNALYETGRSYVQAEQNAQAISVFSQLANKYPDSPVSRKAAAEVGMLYYQQGDYDRAIAAYRQVATQYPGSDEAKVAMRDLKNIYVETNRVDEFAALTAQLPGLVRFEAGEQDSLTYVAAEKVYMKGDTDNARQSFARYLQSFPQGAFSLNAHYYLCVIAKEQQQPDEILAHAAALMEYPNSPYTEEALLMRGEILFERKLYADALTDYRTLQAKASTAARRQLGIVGVMRCAALLADDIETINAATALLAEAQLQPEQQNEALYFRAKAYLRQKAVQKAEADFALLAKDTRTLYGAEAKYQVAQLQYNARQYAKAEKELLNFIEQSTPHAYWLARGFVLLSDVYVAMDKKLDARQYLLSLQQNYQADDDIAGMIEERLAKLQ